MISDESRRRMGWRKGLVFTKFTKNCVICHTPFETVPTSQKQFCCSNLCRWKRRRKWPQPRQCLKCGATFLARRHSHRFCRGHTSIIAKPNIRTLRPFVMQRANNSCERCLWNKEPAVLEVHHRDRNSSNNGFENLILLCPNCHETDHYQSKDGRHRHR